MSSFAASREPPTSASERETIVHPTFWARRARQPLAGTPGPGTRFKTNDRPGGFVRHRSGHSEREGPFVSGGRGVSRRAFLGGLSCAAIVAAAPMPRAKADPGEPPVRIMQSDLLRSEYVDVAGRPLHMLVNAAPPPPDAPTLVLVHGLALSGQYMVPTAEVLAPRYRIYVPDLPGFGDSHKPDWPLDVPALADALAQWMAAVGLDSAMLLGNSFGCQIIADLAARYPERVQAGVLQGPTTPPDERTWLWQFIRWRQNAPYNPPEMEEVADQDYEKCGLVRALITFEFSLRDAIEEKLPHIPAPMLVVRGELDPICRQPWAETMTELLPRGSLVVLPDVAHTLVFTSPVELAEASAPFFDEVARAGGPAS
jgi:2-hydroxy-6-oxonona-2,4-dienedioate hydrolase